MGVARPRLKLMPEKLRLIREHLQASESDMQAMLKLPKTCRIAEYENGVSEPSLIVTLAYSRLWKVSMASVVDDDVSVKEFRGPARYIRAWDHQKVTVSLRNVG